MLTSTGSRLFRFLLLRLIRLRLPFRHIALAIRARFALFWRSILTFARRRGQCQIRLRANDVPVVDGNSIGERPQIPEPAEVEEEKCETLAALPVRRPVDWQDELSRYRDLTSSVQFKSRPVPATPERGSQRYQPSRIR